VDNSKYYLDDPAGSSFNNARGMVKGMLAHTFHQHITFLDFYDIKTAVAYV
jgi:hypothetical protein